MIPLDVRLPACEKRHPNEPSVIITVERLWKGRTSFRTRYCQVCRRHMAQEKNAARAKKVEEREQAENRRVPYGVTAMLNWTPPERL